MITPLIARWSSRSTILYRSICKREFSALAQSEIHSDINNNNNNNNMVPLYETHQKNNKIMNGIANFQMGSDVLRNPFKNQGTAFSLKSRKALRLRGLLPPTVESIALQADRSLTYMRSLHSDLDRYVYLARLKAENSTLYYHMVINNLYELAPIIYTPTVGEACQRFSHIYTPAFSDGLFISLRDMDNIPEILDNWQGPPPSISVVTDGSRILGLGDQGINGMGIPIGKLALYVAAAGFDPDRVLPITLDLGTNNEEYLQDKFYLGTRMARPNDQVFFQFMDKFMTCMKAKWPKILIQFEDFSSEHAFQTLDRYRHDYLMFNDDIQGTGAVILSGFINAVRLSGKDLDAHRILFFGAGSAAVGVASQILEFFVKEGNMSRQEAQKLFWLVDTKGLVTFDRGDKLPEHKKLFARSDNHGQQFKNLRDCLEYVKPTALIGLSSSGGVFTNPILKRMSDLNEHPIIFPLSNPKTKAECSFEDALKATNGSVLFASGTAFPAAKDPVSGKIKVPGQGNNVYIFPGLGLGSFISEAKTISDSMVYASSTALASSLTKEEIEKGLLYPTLNRVREVSAIVAQHVILETIKEGSIGNADIIKMFPHRDSIHDEKRRAQLLKYVESNMWDPVYVENSSNSPNMPSHM